MIPMVSPPQQRRRLPQPSRLDGLPSLSAFINADTDSLIFRKFTRLGARNLLHLQSRLNELESKLDELDKEDVETAKQNPQIRDIAKAYDEVRDAAAQFQADEEEDPDPLMRKFFQDAHERVKLHGEIASALHQYRQSLLEEHQIQSLARPSGSAFEVFKSYFTTPQEGPVLVGHDEKIMLDPEDLVALVRSPDDDRLTRLLSYMCGYWLRERKPARSNLKAPMHSNIVYFPARRVQILSYSVSAILCAVLLVGAMACLGAINQRSWKLSIGMVAVFIFMFAAFVALLTNAKRSEVFASTAAYAAVLVVYVGSGVGPGGRATQENG